MPLQVLIAQGEADAYHASSSSGRTALMEAAAIGKCPCIQALVEEGGSDVNMANELRDGEHPLLVAAAAGGWHSTAGRDSACMVCHGWPSVCCHLKGISLRRHTADSSVGCAQQARTCPPEQFPTSLPDS